MFLWNRQRRVRSQSWALRMDQNMSQVLVQSESVIGSKVLCAASFFFLLFKSFSRLFRKCNARESETAQNGK